MTVSSRSTTDRSPSAPSTRTASSPRARPVLLPTLRASLNLGAENVLPRRPDRTVTKAPDWRCRAQRRQAGWGGLSLLSTNRSPHPGSHLATLDVSPTLPLQGRVKRAVALLSF